MKMGYRKIAVALTNYACRNSQLVKLLVTSTIGLEHCANASPVSSNELFTSFPEPQSGQDPYPDS
jgi:hypothetical protein